MKIIYNGITISNIRKYYTFNVFRKYTINMPSGQLSFGFVSSIQNVNNELYMTKKVPVSLYECET